MSPERRASRAQWEQYLQRVETWAQHALNSAYVGEEPEAEPPEQPTLALPPEFAERARQARLTLQQASQDARAAQEEVGRQISTLRKAPAPHTMPDQARYLDVSG
ncbi:hypothetical protein [Nesterenkonia populi]